MTEPDSVRRVGRDHRRRRSFWIIGALLLFAMLAGLTAGFIWNDASDDAVPSTSERSEGLPSDEPEESPLYFAEAFCDNFSAEGDGEPMTGEKLDFDSHDQGEGGWACSYGASEIENFGIYVYSSDDTDGQTADSFLNDDPGLYCSEGDVADLPDGDGVSVLAGSPDDGGYLSDCVVLESEQGILAISVLAWDLDGGTSEKSDEIRRELLLSLADAARAKALA